MPESSDLNKIIAQIKLITARILRGVVILFEFIGLEFKIMENIMMVIHFFLYYNAIFNKRYTNPSTST